MARPPPLSWLSATDPFPPHEQAWPAESEAPGLLAASHDLNSAMLLRAYRHATYPWYSPGQPVLWWSPTPRMILGVDDFRLHRSMRKTLAAFQQARNCEIRFDSCFEAMMRCCASSGQRQQTGTWITEAMIEAYCDLHRLGHAHSVETWVDGHLVGGLYCVALGAAIFGESMFCIQPNASKIALAALVAFSRGQGFPLIDCQQNTPHLASLGARERPRSEVLAWLAETTVLPSPPWEFPPDCWQQLRDTR